MFEFIQDFYDLDIFVISTHRSKSIDLPVIYFERLDTEFIIRDNFYDFKLSIISERDIKQVKENKPQVLGFFSHEKISSCYCEGFKKEWVFDSYLGAIQKNENRFTCEVGMTELLFLVLKHFMNLRRKE